MANRPLGIDPPSREFEIGVSLQNNSTKSARLRNWWYHFKNFSLGRGSIIEVDIDDKILNSLKEMGWIEEKNNEWFMTRFGDQELKKHMRQRLEKFNDGF